jgi:DNA repair protein RadC
VTVVRDLTWKIAIPALPDQGGDPIALDQAYIQMTKAAIDIAMPLGISVRNHIIVGKNGHASLKGMRLI